MNSGRLSTRNKNARTLSALRQHMSAATGGSSLSRDALTPETLQLLLLRNLSPLKDRGAAAVPEVVEFLSSYDLSKPVISYTFYLFNS